MPVRILIVDDERLERVLIRKSFDWEKNGFQIAGEAADAREALAFFREERPEVVFTDINMPDVDGLELSRLLRQENPQVKIVIITGYQDFEYAQTAIRLGVKDFLLKPIHPEELEKVSVRLTEELDRERELQQRLNESLPLLANQLCRRIVAGRVGEEERKEALLQCGLPDIFDGDLICCVIRAENAEGDAFSGEAARAVPERTERILFRERENTYVLLAKAPWPEDTPNRIRRALSEKLRVPVTVTVSRVRRGLEGARLCYDEASKALLGSILLGNDTVISCETYERLEKCRETDYLADFEDYEFAVKNGLKERAVAFVDGYLAHYNETGIASVDELHTIGTVLLHHTSLALRGLGCQVSDVQDRDIYGLVSRASSLDEFCAAFYPFLTAALEFAEGASSRTANTLISRCVGYLEENLSMPGLSLKTAAAALYVNESYLSRSFRQVRNETMTEYIMRRRIENSIRLLKTTDLKGYEISERVGIPDAHYFGQCFKKYMGMTVNQFIGKNQDRLRQNYELFPSGETDTINKAKKPGQDFSKETERI